MRIPRAVFLVSLLAASYVTIAGCGSDDPATPPADAGSTTETSTTDSSPPPPPADAQSDTNRSPELTGLECKNVSECYAGLDAAALQGEPVCLDKVQNGYCTHKCNDDSDCCAVPGECKTGLKQVCSSFENQPDKYCFLSCEEADIASASDAGATDAGVLDGGGFDGDQYCKVNASAALGCRSTGGGAQNRKVCLPTGGGGGGDGGGGGRRDAGDASSDAPNDG